MNCPVCGMEMGNNQYCPNCGANMAAFQGVSQDKVIINQTPQQQMAMGDDSVTQLIPENYMNATGDDTATVMLDPNQAPQYMPNQQPMFAQAPVNNQPAFNQMPAGGFQQPIYNPNVASSYGATNTKGGIKVYSLICFLAILLAMVVTGIFMTKPIFYILQSYAGGYMDDDEIIEEMYDMGDVQEANMAYRIFIGAMLVLFVIAALNAWVAYARVNTGCIKSPFNKSVGAFVFSMLAFAIIAFLTFGLGAEVEDFANDYADELKDYAKFNVYNLCFYTSLIAMLLNLGAMFTSASAKRKTR